jgi:hypothetical protein
MDKNKLAALALMEFEKKAPEEIKNYPEKLKEFLQNYIDRTLLDDLINEFCEKNPNDSYVLNPLTVSKNAGESIIALEYKKIINRAGLSYRADELIEQLQNLSDEI